MMVLRKMQLNFDYYYLKIFNKNQIIFFQLKINTFKLNVHFNVKLN